MCGPTSRSTRRSWTSIRLIWPASGRPPASTSCSNAGGCHAHPGSSNSRRAMSAGLRGTTAAACVLLLVMISARVEAGAPVQSTVGAASGDRRAVAAVARLLGVVERRRSRIPANRRRTSRWRPRTLPRRRQASALASPAQRPIRRAPRQSYRREKGPPRQILIPKQTLGRR